MRNGWKRYLNGSLALLVAAACSQNAPVPTEPTVVTSVDLSPAISKGFVPENFRTHLSADDVIPALPIDSPGQGEAIFQLTRDPATGELVLDYHVNVANITNVTGAHLHMGAVGIRGPLVALLSAPLPANGGRTDGVLVVGRLRANGVFPPLNGTTLSALMDQIRAGNIYVDIPTNDGVPPAGTGPGDYIGGELRGQIR